MAKRSVIFLILSVALLIGLGITMLASTSFFTKEGGGEAYVTVWKQVMWVGLSIAACLVTALIDYNRWYKWRWGCSSAMNGISRSGSATKQS
jgi:cell division protein FtsW